MYLIVAASEQELPSCRNEHSIARPVGIGLVESALHTAHLIEHYNPELVICTGSCGSVDPALQINNIVIPSTVQHWGFSTPFSHTIPALPLHQIHDRLDEKAYPYTIHRDVILGSADIFLDTKEYEKWGKKLETLGIQAVDMESYAVAAACHSRGVDCVVLRYVSDSREEGKVKNYRAFLADMREKAAALIGDILDAAE